MKNLPDPATWRDYVTFLYLPKSGQAKVDSSDGSVDAAALVFDPDARDTELKVARKSLRDGSAATYFRNQVVMTDAKYKVTTLVGGIKHYLSAKTAVELQLGIAEVALIARFNFDATEHRCEFAIESNAFTVTDIFIERLNEHTDKYRIYKYEAGKNQYLYHVAVAGNLIFTQKSNEVLLIFDFEEIPPPPAPASKALPRQTRSLSRSKRTMSQMGGNYVIVAPITNKNPSCLSLADYFNHIGRSGYAVLSEMLSLMLGSSIGAQFTSLNQMVSTNASFIDHALKYTLNPKSTVVLSGKGEVSSAKLFLNLPAHPPTFLGGTVNAIDLVIADANTANLSVRMFAQYVSHPPHEIDITPHLDLSKRDDSLSYYLQIIHYQVAVSACYFKDKVLLLLGGIATGSVSYLALPLSLAYGIRQWRVDNARSKVNFTDIVGKAFVQTADIKAVVNNSPIQMGPIQAVFQELCAHYEATDNTMMYTGQVTVSHQSQSKEASFRILQDFSTTAQVEFVVKSTTLTQLLAFLNLNSSLAHTYAPMLGKFLDSITVEKMGFTLKQGVFDSSHLDLESVFIEVSNPHLGSQIPSSIQPSKITARVSIFQPSSSNPAVGVQADFAAAVHSSTQNYALQSQLSVLPVHTTDDRSSDGYLCTCSLVTKDDTYSGGASVGSIMALLGLQNMVQGISSSVPALAPLLNNVTLNEVSLAYNSASASHIQNFYISLSIPHWNLFGTFSLDDFDLRLQYSSSSGWSACVKGDVEFDSSFIVSVEFRLPTSTLAGSFSFQNNDEDFTLNKLMTSIGLPSLSSVPILGSILNVTIQNATLGLESRSGGLSLYGFKTEIYMDLKIFRISEVNVTLAYNVTRASRQVSFSFSGFINSKAYLEASYDPALSEIKGRLLVTTGSSLSVNECVNILQQNSNYSNNHAYSTVSSKATADVFLKLKYFGAQGTVSINEFSITLSSVLSFGGLVLSKLQLVYKRPLGSTPPGSTVNYSLHLLAQLEQTTGLFGLQLSIDCKTVSSTGSKDVTATIQPTAGKTLSLRSFLSLFRLTNPILPESGAASKPSTDGFLDLQLVSGSLTFQTSPFKMKNFDITTATSSTGWVLLNDPDVTIREIYLRISYNEGSGISAVFNGTIIMASVTIQVTGIKTNQESVFSLKASPSTDNNLMNMVHALSPGGKQAINCHSY